MWGVHCGLFGENSVDRSQDMSWQSAGSCREGLWRGERPWGEHPKLDLSSSGHLGTRGTCPGPPLSWSIQDSPFRLLLPPAFRKNLCRGRIVKRWRGCPGSWWSPGDVQEMPGCDTECCGLVDKVVISQRLDLMILESFPTREWLCVWLTLALPLGPLGWLWARHFFFWLIFSHLRIMTSFKLKLENHTTVKIYKIITRFEGIVLDLPGENFVMCCSTPPASLNLLLVQNMVPNP